MTFSPTSASPVTDSLVVASDRGSGDRHRWPRPPSPARRTCRCRARLDFGDVPVGTSATRAFQITNTGNVPMTITKAKAPQGVFSTTTPIAEGLKIPAGESAYQSVTFTPTAVGQAGTAETYYLITADDGQGALKVMLTGNGTDDPIAAYAWKIGAGDPRSTLGRSLTLEYAVAGGKCQDYVRGVICWSPATGAHAVIGEIYKRYKAAGGAAGAPRLPDHRREGVAGRGGAVQPLLRLGRVLDLLVADDRGALRTGCDPDQMGVAGLGDRTAGLSDHGREAHAGRGGAVQPLLGCGRGTRSTGRRRPGRTGSPVRSGPSGRPWAGRQGRWAIRPPTRRRRRTGWGGTTTSRVRVGTRSTGRRRPGRTLSSVRSGPSGRPWAGRQAAGLSDHRREGHAGRVGRYNHFSGSGGHSIYWSPKTGAHSVTGCDPGQVGVPGLGERAGWAIRPATSTRFPSAGHRTFSAAG